MNTSTATASVSKVREELEQQFTEWASKSFAAAMEAMSNATFYKTVLRRINNKESIENEVPEVAGMDEVDVREAVMALEWQAHEEMTKTWELATTFEPCFLTTIRTTTPADELLPQYDVEYAGRDNYAGARVRVSTWRRNLKVEITGTDAELEALRLQMSQVALVAQI